MQEPAGHCGGEQCYVHCGGEKCYVHGTPLNLCMHTACFATSVRDADMLGIHEFHAGNS